MDTLVLCREHVPFTSKAMAICRLSSGSTTVCVGLADILFLNLGVVPEFLASSFRVGVVFAIYPAQGRRCVGLYLYG